MISRDGWFERGKNEDLPVRADLENRSAAIAYEEIFVGIEGDSCGDAHAFHPELRTPVRRDAVNRAVVAAGDIEYVVLVQSQTRGIQQFGGVRLHLVIGRNFIERNGNLLAALPAVSDINVSLAVH